LFNHSLVVLSGQAERNAIVSINGVSDSEFFTVDPGLIDPRIEIDNCIVTSNPDTDGIREICDWRVSDFQLDSDNTQDIDINNPVSYTVTDSAGNTQTFNHNYIVNLYSVNLSINTDIEYFSPNGDGIQDGIEFIEMSTDGIIQNWEIRIRNSENELVRTLSGEFSLPTNVYWDGKDEEGNWVTDGDYTYTLYILTTDDVEIETLPVNIYSRTSLDNQVIITFPKNNAVTTRGIINVQGQADSTSGLNKPNKVKICIDTIGVAGSCDFEFYSDIDEFNSF